MKRLPPVIAAVVAVLALAACGGADVADDTASPTAPPGDQGTDGATGGGVAGGTAPRAYELAEALSATIEGPLLVTGLLIDDGSGWRLCGAIAESYPPQCAGEAVDVEDIDPAWYDLQEEGDVRWMESATVFGELTDGVLTAVGDPASA